MSISVNTFSPNQDIRGNYKLIDVQSQALNIESEKAAKKERYSSYAELQDNGLLSVASSIRSMESRAEHYTQVQKVNEGRLNYAISILEEVQSQVTQFIQAAINTAGGVGQDKIINLPSFATEALEIIKSQLNTSYSGRALFGSLNQTDAPIGDVINTSSLDSHGLPTTSYTSDSPHPCFVDLSPGVKLRTDIDITQDGFKNLIGAMQTFKDGGFPTPRTTIETGLTLLNTALNQLNDIVTNLQVRAQSFAKAEGEVVAMREDAKTQKEKLLEYPLEESMINVSESRSILEYLLALEAMRQQIRPFYEY
ncbi:MAG: hypothetical protein V4485_01705 [Pseudomonadota bacterium]